MSSEITPHDELYFFDDEEPASVRAAYEAAEAFRRLVRAPSKLSVYRRGTIVCAVAIEAVAIGENFVFADAA